MTPFEPLHVFIMVISLAAGFYLGYETQRIGMASK